MSITILGGGGFLGAKLARRLARDIQVLLEEQFGDEVCKTRIAESVSLAESPVYNKTVFEHSPSSRGAQDYEALLNELLRGGFL